MEVDLEHSEILSPELLFDRTRFVWLFWNDVVRELNHGSIF